MVGVLAPSALHDIIANPEEHEADRARLAGVGKKAAGHFALDWVTEECLFLRPLAHGEEEEGEETPEAVAATEALEEMSFYADANGISLLEEEGSEAADDWDEEPWNNVDEDNLGEYEE